MKKGAMKAVCCYILCLALVAVYSSFHVSDPDFDLTDFAPEYEEFDYDHSYAEIYSTCFINGWFVTNAEGQGLRHIYRKEALERLYNRYTDWGSDRKLDYKTYLSLRDQLHRGLYGNIKCNFSIPMGGTPSITVPFSKTFSMPAIPMHKSLPMGQELEMTPSQKAEWERELYPSYSGVLFHYGDTDETLREDVRGFTGTIVFHSDNVVELFGNIQDVEVSFFSFGKDHSQFIEWEACGSGGLYAKFSLVGDEVIAEGMTGGYTVTKYDNDRLVDGKPLVLYTKAYDETGEEIPYTPPEDETKEDF